MITKAIVKELISNGYRARVRIPFFENSNSKDELLFEATICCLPNSSNIVQVGDVVFVGFEDNDTSKPIILGQLYRENMNENSKINLNVGSFSTSSTTKLDKNTMVGNITYDEILEIRKIKELN